MIVRDLIRDPHPGRARAKNHDPLLARPRPRDAQPGQDRGDRDRARALNVVVKKSDPVAVLVQDPPRVRGAEILEMQQRPREQLCRRLHIRRHQCVVAFTPHSAVAVTDIHRVLQQRLPVRAHIQAHRDHPVGIDPRRRRVHAQLADRDRKPVHPPVADPENRLRVSRHEQIDILDPEPEVAQRRLDTVDVIDREIHAIGPLILMAVALDRLRHHRVIDDRQHLLQMIPQESVIENLIAVTQRREKLVFGQTRGLRVELLIRSPRLLLK
jgi:hypothetical protein